ncbi:hypothetical protein Hdeb2414_s0012g00385161 [Helianthus debilis subsp. tardiflorus]
MKKQCDDVVALLTQNMKVAPDQINHIMAGNGFKLFGLIMHTSDKMGWLGWVGLGWAGSCQIRFGSEWAESEWIHPPYLFPWQLRETAVAATEDAGSGVEDAGTAGEDAVSV